VEYRSFGRTGVKVSSVCLGAMMFGGRTNAEDGYEIIDKAIDLGINFIDTANVYNLGGSETVVGEALKRNGRRERMVIATKVNGVIDAEDPNGRGNSRRHIIMQCEASLRRLQTDWIDLYQLHRADTEMAQDETLRAMDDLVRSGKVRYIGTSNYAAWQMVESFMVSKEYGLNRFVCTQPPYNLLDRRVERELIPMCQTYGVAVIPWSPLAGGTLTGKYRRDEPIPGDARFANMTGARYARFLNERMHDVIEGLEPLAAEKGVPLSQLALAWVHSRPGVTSAIIGPRTMEQFDDNMAALNVELTEEDLLLIDEIAPPGEHTVNYYAADFGPHPYRW
jgi:aryl-alcohol dehydrogenase-like predicted oxidoreductase